MTEATRHIALPFLYLKVKGYWLFHISGGGLAATFHIRTGPKSPFSPSSTLQLDVHSQRDIINTLSPSTARIKSGFTHFLRFVELVFMIKVSYLETVASRRCPCLWGIGDIGNPNCRPKRPRITRRGNEITQVRNVSPWISSLSLVIDVLCLPETWSQVSKCLSGTRIESLMTTLGRGFF